MTRIPVQTTLCLKYYRAAEFFLLFTVPKPAGDLIRGRPDNGIKRISNLAGTRMKYDLYTYYVYSVILIKRSRAHCGVTCRTRGRDRRRYAVAPKRTRQ